MNKLLLTTTTLFVLWSTNASPTQAQRVRSLEAIINTPLTSTARNICRSIIATSTQELL